MAVPVDDEEPILQLLDEFLTDEGYEVETSIDGEALKEAPPFQPDVILLDIMMPDMDGIEVSRGLKANPVTSHIPIVLMTAYQNAQKRFEISEADYIIGKPFDLDKLLELLGRITGPAK